jgi:hypothetical protein
MVKPDTLHIQKPFGQTLLLTLAFFPLLLGVFEIFSRTLLAAPSLPPPSVGSTSPEFEIKIERLNDWIARNGPIDCILLGSSAMNGGIDPVALSQAYADLTGNPLMCFNFGLSSLVGEPAGPIAHMLVKKYQPRLLILGTSPRDLSDQFGELARPLTQTPWLRYLMGDSSFEGWLIDNSSAYRYYLGMQNWKNPENRPVIEEYEAGIDKVGYQKLPNQHKELVQLEEVLLENYALNPPDVTGFRQALSQNQVGTQVVLLDMPVHPVFYHFYVAGGEQAYQDIFYQPMASMAAEYGVPMWETQTSVAPTLPADGWNDRRHLNEDGARAFSAWLAGKIATAVQEGLIVDSLADISSYYLPVVGASQ